MTFLRAVDEADTRRLEEIGKRWLDESCQLFPEQASRLGFRAFEGELSENSPETHRKHIDLNRVTLAAVEALPESAFRGDAWLDRRGFLSRLRTEIFYSADLERWRTNPQSHCDAAVDSIFDLLVRSASRPAKALPAIESRLAKIPGFLAAGAECIRRPVPLWTDLAERACAGSVEFLQGLESELSRVSPHPKKTISLLRSAGRAFEEYARTIRRKRPGLPGSFAIGRERFEFLIRERLGLSLSLPEAIAAGERLIARHEYLLESAAARIGKKPARELIEAAASKWSPGAALLDVYKTTSDRLRSALATADIVSLPEGESLKVMAVPPFLRHQFPTAAYSAPPPFSRNQQGIFWVNDLGGGQSDAETRQHFGLELTSVHEGYPGHHLQFVVQYRHPSRLRRLFEHSIFYEGWTMWCEKMAVERKLVDFPHAQLIQIHDALWRAHRIVIDCGLQSGALTPAAAAKRLQKGVGFTAARAAGDVNWYTAAPTVPMSYLLGRIELEKLHRYFTTSEGWTLRQFNDWALSHGALPWSWIWQARLER
ncbi:MAG: DUF885 domain-containing protein [Terrimicrobiaceae bacterium]|nr:DUF885 domain-containing protein [Terrimicrobiaceae bacterium]